MFHVQLRQFPHVARAFNLGRDELDTRILRPWLAGRTVEWSEQKFTPERTKLTIYEGPELRPEEISMGRGWGNAARAGEDVTEQLLAESTGADRSAIEPFKQVLIQRCGQGAIAFSEIVGLAGTIYPQARVSQRLELAEQAIWELLHAGFLTLALDGANVPQDRWEPVLLDWRSWSPGGASASAAH